MKWAIRELLYLKGGMRFTDMFFIFQAGKWQTTPIKSRNTLSNYLKKLMKEGDVERDIDTRKYIITDKGERIVSSYIKKLLIGIIDDIEHMKIKSAKYMIMGLIRYKRMGFNNIFERGYVRSRNTLSKYLKELMKEGCIKRDESTREYIITPKGESVYALVDKILSTPWQANRAMLLGELSSGEKTPEGAF